MVSRELIEEARAGDQDAFAELVQPYRHELQLHCYRLLGSLQDAEDALQDGLLSVWRSLPSFESRSSFRTWNYGVTTSRCLDALRARRRHQAEIPVPDFPHPTRLGEVLWLEPYPDELLERIADRDPGPEARYETRESLSLAFIKALQMLPPRQRAALILRDALGFHAAEVAEILESTEESVTSALKRARATMAKSFTTEDRLESAIAPNSPEERELAERFARCYERHDVDGLIALLREDVWVRMPPVEFEYQGLEQARAVFESVRMAHLGVTTKLVATRANGQPAFGIYRIDRQTGVFRGTGLFVLGISGGKIRTITRFEGSLLSRFGLPRILSE